MKDNEKLQKLKENYMNIEIPDKIDDIVNQAINNKKSANKKNIIKTLGIVAASLVVFIGSVNISPVFADTLEDIPVIGNIVKVVNFSNYNFNKNGFDVSIKVPKVEGLKNKKLENELNEELQKEGKSLYNDYVNEVKELQKGNIQGRKVGESWYEVKTDNDDILSLVIFNYQAQGSTNTTRKFYNINKKNETAITLKSMYKDKDYISIISENIKSQMKEQMKTDPDKYYWVDSDIPEMDFKAIKEDQGFYINENNELVICFDKYEVAPGYMGLVEFVIPQEILKLIIK
ncbi:anti-sigma-V factor rsiV [Romboutsia sp.]|uniref:anti-sigma-V factor rsiV n=1 Tax=Romboutsia sp. TaxID=1965302 RepID=UPI002BFC8938|nr:anti-sigma-V factor rsiV [Romboutsia sp.]HSQ89996.1 anti-sigma-V factor rsiV [Romboutsia sp.]